MEPLSHCHVPWLEVAALPVITRPRRALAVEPPLTVSELSEKRAEKRVVTVAPTGSVVSSLTAERVAEPVAMGASFTAVNDVPRETVAAE